MGFSLLSMLLLLSSNDWFFLFLSVEFLTLSSYCLIAVPGSKRSLEAVLKYFAAGAMSTCLLLFGMFMLFVSCDSTSFSVFPTEQIAALIFTAFCSCAFLIKAGSAPFHYWVADAYEGSPTIVMVFLSIVVKLCIFFTLARLLYGPLLEGASL
jgi:NADH-quinone oxidoreductase subunit N